MDLQGYQFVANLSALVVVGLLYVAYVRNLRSTIELKQSEIQFWKDKAADLERKTPEHIERVLARRIEIREQELVRLHEDDQKHRREIDARNSELKHLRVELNKAKDVGRSVVMYDLESDQDVVVPTSELQLVELGEVFVDSACLMIADPSYVASQWHDEEYVPERRRFRDAETGRVYEHRVNFRRFDERIDGFDSDVNALIHSGRLKQLEEPEPEQCSMSLAGALYATRRSGGYGPLCFEGGEEGAGLVVRTVHGDGVYPVYGEAYDGSIVRVYVSLL